MSNKLAAADALLHARNATSTFRSSNKFYDEQTQNAKYRRRIESGIYRSFIEPFAPKRGATIDDICDYALKVTRDAHGAANCGELAALACAYLKNRDDDALVFDFVILEAPGDHAFVVVGEPPPPDGIYPADFADWQHDAYICDPWANLVCRAAKYPIKWRAKMQKWDGDGKRLGKPGTEYLGQLTKVSPTDVYWADALTSHDKLSLTYQAPIITTGKKKKNRGCVIF